MIYQRAELHNHTTESDGSMTVQEFAEYAQQRGFEWAAVTDHNTCAGAQKARRFCKEQNVDLKIIRGVELTTFYGHILALGISQMIRVEDLDPRSPERFLRKIKTEGSAGVVGIAHPFCVGEPLMIGCRSSLNITDWSCVDYIEVFNTSAGSGKEADCFAGNRNAFELWKKLVLQGYKLAPVTGKDTHTKQKEEPVFITYLYGVQNADCSEEAEESAVDAIQNQRTIVTKGPRFYCAQDEDGIHICFDHTSDYFNWNQKCKDMKMVLRITNSRGESREWAVTAQTENLKIAEDLDSPLTAELFCSECSYPNLLAAAVFNGRNVQ